MKNTIENLPKCSVQFSLPTTAVARARELHTQVEAALSIVKDLREARATWVQVKTTLFAVINEPKSISSTGVAYSGDRAWRRGVEAELAFLVEVVSDDRGRHCADLVQVELAFLAFVLEAYAGFHTPIAAKWGLCVLYLELVVWVAVVEDLFVELHGF